MWKAASLSTLSWALGLWECCHGHANFCHGQTLSPGYADWLVPPVFVSLAWFKNMECFTHSIMKEYW